MKPIKSGKAFLAVAFIVSILLPACRKADAGPEPKQMEPAVFKEIVEWLDGQKQKFKDAGSQQAITSLEENLIGSQLKMVQVNDKQRFIIIPLKPKFKTSRSKSESSIKVFVVTENNHFKLSNIFEITDPQMKEVSGDLISRIYSGQDNNLTGVCTILTLTNKFVTEREYRSGKLYSAKYLAKKEPVSLASSQKTASCIDWYLQTYIDGIMVDEQYLGTDCGINVEDGGGAGAFVESNTIEASIDTDEPDPADEAAAGNPGGFVNVRYHHNAYITKISSTGEIISVIMVPVTADPMISAFIDKYARAGTRILALLNQNNTYIILTASSVLLSWACSVIGIYTYVNGNPLWSRAWNHTSMAVQ